MQQLLLRLILLWRYIPLLKILKYHAKNAGVVIWIYPQCPKYFFDYLNGGAIIRELALMRAFVRKGTKFRLIIGKKVGKLYGKKIFFRMGGKNHNFFDFSNFPSILPYLVEQLEHQGNVIAPTKNEAMLWQNKAHMHALFDKLQINTPTTCVISSGKLFSTTEYSYPFLIKTLHSSAAKGVYKIASAIDLDKLNSSEFISKNLVILKQDLLNIRRDLRVILIGDEIVLHYWRINNSEEWKPTSTGYGSSVDFISFPENWRQHIIDTFKKLNITTGAFDIAWENDDLNTPPLFLEVSSEYMPNPEIRDKNISYTEYKKRFKWRNSYQERFFNLVFELTEKELKTRKV